MCTFLRSLSTFRNPVVETTNQVQLANLDVCLDNDQFGNLDIAYVSFLRQRGYHAYRFECRQLQDTLTVRSIPSVQLVNPGRFTAKMLVPKAQGSGTAMCIKGAAAGEVADVLIFGFVLGSKVVDGRTYTTSQGQNRVLKELEILPIQQEWERTLAVLSMALGSKLVNLAVTEEGAIAFSTKHTTVDEDGNAEKKSECSMALYIRLAVADASY